MESIRDYLANPSAIERDARFCSIDNETRPLLHLAAAEISSRPHLLADLMEIDQAIGSGDLIWNEAPWKQFPSDGSVAEAFLLAFPILHHVESIRAFYEARRIPERYLQALMSDLQRWILTHRQWTMGRPGFREISWLREHVRGRLFEIGRLQFQPGEWTLPVIPLENRLAGNRILLSGAEGDSITNDGGYSSAARSVSDDGRIPIAYEEAPTGITGHRILPDGTISRSPEKFDTPPWRKISLATKPVIRIHIPCGAPLSTKACLESIREALVFFRTYFPDRPFGRPKALICESWLLYPDFQKILPLVSNIVGFQRLFRLFPLPATGDSQFYERVFAPWGRTVTRDKLTTSLQIALFDHIRSGHTPLEGGGIIFTDDLGKAPIPDESPSYPPRYNSPR